MGPAINIHSEDYCLNTNIDRNLLKNNSKKIEKMQESVVEKKIKEAFKILDHVQQTLNIKGELMTAK